MREQRKALPDPIRHKAAEAVARHLIRARILQPGQRIAAYAAIEGEIDPAPTVRYAQRLRSALYMPHIVDMRACKMEFVEQKRPQWHWRDKNSMASRPRSMFRRIDPRKLDVVLVPLVAFDEYGWRLGFGAGFYDRKFSFLHRRHASKPLLIGLGYEFQRIARQNPSQWDVPLHAVVTERGFHRRRRG
jgi:5-formyltetrahydrofolate cyclo-ligase